MSEKTMNRFLLITALAVGVGGCRSVATEHDRAARIIHADDASRAALQRAVNDALNTNVTLANNALTESSLLIIERSLPRSMQSLPAQGRNMEVPIQFRLVINRKDCILIDQRDRSRYELENTTCEAE
ncbi:MAG: hypothetical protein JRG67_12855 [Deltaproteobacteria bacterium]|nr:hypothetical protein [Deltaproteobacteria bacterium]MBW1876249.1 hypothetical protein [Deltaproteobacteria bacterium]MBW2211906.1 hypothetical protein [Deltaproteobacteria bacterium]MBW2215312.1 hypothetical protein [Deltaproteobacteria bacterium]MBW2628842.1 hypothetical protein [Deltaproteobacteria bacterium]